MVFFRFIDNSTAWEEFYISSASTDTDKTNSKCIFTMAFNKRPMWSENIEWIEDTEPDYNETTWNRNYRSEIRGNPQLISLTISVSNRMSVQKQNRIEYSF